MRCASRHRDSSADAFAWQSFSPCVALGPSPTCPVLPIALAHRQPLGPRSRTCHTPSGAWRHAGGRKEGMERHRCKSEGALRSALQPPTRRHRAHRAPPALARGAGAAGAGAARPSACRHGGKSPQCAVPCKRLARLESPALADGKPGRPAAAMGRWSSRACTASASARVWSAADPPACHVGTGTGLTPWHICTGVGLAPATSAPGLGSPLAHCIGLGYPLSHLHRDRGRPPDTRRRDDAVRTRSTLQLGAGEAEQQRTAQVGAPRLVSSVGHALHWMSPVGRLHVQERA